MNKRVAKKNKKNVKRDPEHINCLWGLLCSMSSIDQQRNNISLFNVISNLNVPKGYLKGEKVLLGEKHELVVVFRRALEVKFCTDRVVIDTKASLIDPTGAIINEIFTPVTFEAGKRTMRYRLQMPVFQLTVHGDYVYRIEVKQPNSEKFISMNEIPFEVSETDTLL